MDVLLELCFPQLQLANLHPQISLAEKATHVALGVQPRGHSFGLLVPEFCSHCRFVCPASQPKAVEGYLKGLPKGAKILRKRLGTGVDFGPSLMERDVFLRCHA